MMGEITCRLTIISIVLMISVLGCAHVVTVDETYTSTGQKGYVIDCSGDSDYHLVDSVGKPWLIGSIEP